MRIENQISTMFIHDAPVRVKWKCTRVWRSNQRLTWGVECVDELSTTRAMAGGEELDLRDLAAPDESEEGA